MGELTQYLTEMADKAKYPQGVLQVSDSAEYRVGMVEKEWGMKVRIIVTEIVDGHTIGYKKISLFEYVKGWIKWYLGNPAEALRVYRYRLSKY